MSLAAATMILLKAVAVAAFLVDEGKHDAAGLGHAEESADGGAQLFGVGTGAEGVEVALGGSGAGSASSASHSRVIVSEGPGDLEGGSGIGGSPIAWQRAGRFRFCGMNPAAFQKQRRCRVG